MIFAASYIADLQWQLDRMDWQADASGQLIPPSIYQAHAALRELECDS